MNRGFAKAVKDRHDVKVIVRFISSRCYCKFHDSGSSSELLLAAQVRGLPQASVDYDTEVVLRVLSKCYNILVYIKTL
jgi:hypothetical protein